MRSATFAVHGESVEAGLYDERRVQFPPNVPVPTLPPPSGPPSLSREGLFKFIFASRQKCSDSFHSSLFLSSFGSYQKSTLAGAFLSFCSASAATAAAAVVAARYDKESENNEPDEVVVIKKIA